eukprot:TRINITY_DN19945_c0_g1_i1.p1 TRINITY_DN19945_c0_g1~~TRINITY_DN19945_c0_g1_i1.p1  ORF type:complete len:442 (+),score=110.86 TRINITY_DN19945_c0_g1_i1:98-1423(+)
MVLWAVVDLAARRGVLAPEDLCLFAAASQGSRASVHREEVWQAVARKLRLRGLPASQGERAALDQLALPALPAAASLLRRYLPVLAVRRRVRALWRRIEAFWLRLGPQEAAKAWRPGLGEASLEAAEAALGGVELPEDLAESLRCHDGQEAECFFFAEALLQTPAFRVLRLLPLSEALGTCKRPCAASCISDAAAPRPVARSSAGSRAGQGDMWLPLAETRQDALMPAESRSGRCAVLLGASSRDRDAAGRGADDASAPAVSSAAAVVEELDAAAASSAAEPRPHFGEIWRGFGAGAPGAGSLHVGPPGRGLAVPGPQSAARQSACFADYLAAYVGFLEGLESQLLVGAGATAAATAAAPQRCSSSSWSLHGGIAGEEALRLLFASSEIPCVATGGWRTTGLGKGKGDLWRWVGDTGQPVRAVLTAMDCKGVKTFYRRKGL